MNTYETKKAARIERLEKRIERLKSFAEGKDLSMFGEARSGIPLGQPILVGHHSERRHRRHLERIERIVRAGYDAEKKAKQLQERLAGIHSSRAIASDNPDARQLVADKMAKLETQRDKFKTLNALVRKNKTPESLCEALKLAFPEIKGDPMSTAIELLTPDFAGRVGIPDYRLTNMGAEIRRLKKRLDALSVIQSEFKPFEINEIKIDMVDGQIQVEFPWKPCEETREKLKRSPLALKWSSYSKKWVRKHTETTCSQYFQTELKKVLSEARE